MNILKNVQEKILDRMGIDNDGSFIVIFTLKDCVSCVRYKNEIIKKSVNDLLQNKNIKVIFFGLDNLSHQSSQKLLIDFFNFKVVPFTVLVKQRNIINYFKGYKSDQEIKDIVSKNY